MKKKFACAAITLLLCVGLPSAFAMGSLAVVTKATQAKMGLDYTLIADRADAEAVLVRMEIPRKGKLQNIRTVEMRIGEGRPLVSAPLRTTTEKNGAWIASFQVSSELANHCYIDLTVPKDGGYEVYAVEVKGYVTDRK